jgi:mannose/cellobiose epimerase-like protein (N-acyl-D-glucosamine 2-epimerase family)
MDVPNDVKKEAWSHFKDYQTGCWRQQRGDTRGFAPSP